jgi:hypothetical protein
MHDFKIEGGGRSGGAGGPYFADGIQKTAASIDVVPDGMYSCAV